MKVKHFAISTKPKESMSGLLERVATKIEDVNDANLLSITIQKDEEQWTSTIYFDGGTSLHHEKLYDMQLIIFANEEGYSSSVDAVRYAQNKFMMWLEQQDKKVEIYDISTVFDLDPAGDNRVAVMVYYDFQKDEH